MLVIKNLIFFLLMMLPPILSISNHFFSNLNFFFVGISSKKFLESNNANVLWFSLIKILNSCENIFTMEQYENLRNCTDDELALISSNLTLLQQHLLGENIVCFIFVFYSTFSVCFLVLLYIFYSTTNSIFFLCAILFYLRFFCRINSCFCCHLFYNS
jgi:hypothetical protein